MNTDEKQLNSLIDDILNHSGRGGKINQLLQNLVEAVNDQPLLLWDSKKIEALSQVALRVLFLDCIDDEDEEIQWAHKTFAYITQALVSGREKGKEDSELFHILRSRVILLHSHDDFFIDTLDYFFFHDTPIQKDTDRYDRRAFILRRIAAMQTQDLRTLESYNNELYQDEYLLEAEQTLSDKYQFSEEELVEAQLLSDTLFKYIWHQNK
ncbi:hypothetical protein C7377_1408 [Balneicella halophila]|uniref:Uncharacterized protein n=1 Tax=Balneicella halophila TaxID=1537566 RepID=A0A7L4UPL7_BALHA|nr:hypothetical protein [Balneicella halophila]PVX51075.1 hypothetical protein C7377_1408 [Balneicella halophila]